MWRQSSFNRQAILAQLANRSIGHREPISLGTPA